MEKYKATWASLDSRPLPQWFDEAKIGVFLHWGVYSVPSYAPHRSEVSFPDRAYAEWYAHYVQESDSPQRAFHERAYAGKTLYQDLAASWDPVFFDADEWMRLFRYAGAKYFIPTAKHHDGFCLYNSAYSHNWNSVDIGPKRDIIEELMNACDKYGITRGMYYSILEWFHPYMRDGEKGVYRYAGEKMLPQFKELVERFRPHILFSDGSWDYPSDAWRSKEFLAWLYNESSVRETVVVNDRWGSETIAAHGGYFTSEYEFINSQAMSEEEAREKFRTHKFSEGRSLGYSFGFNRNERYSDYLTERELIETLTDVICRGGNFLLNVGPCADGTIMPLIEERLVQLGDWMKVNGEAIYGSRPVHVDGLSEGCGSVCVGDDVYIFCRRYPKVELKLRSPLFTGGDIRLLGSDAPVPGRVGGGEAVFTAPCLTVDEMPCRCVYTFRIRKNGENRPAASSMGA